MDLKLTCLMNLMEQHQSLNFASFNGYQFLFEILNKKGTFSCLNSSSFHFKCYDASMCDGPKLEACF
jgi:hypothetical protein